MKPRATTGAECGCGSLKMLIRRAKTAATINTHFVLRPLLLFMAMMRPNDQSERREAAAADIRMRTEPNGCLPFAALCGFGSVPSHT